MYLPVNGGLLAAIIVIFASLVFLKLRQTPARTRGAQTGSLKQICDVTDAEFEIISVHGLAADPDWTWIQIFPTDVKGDSQYSADKDKQSMHDLLKRKFPSARILSFTDNSTHLGSDSVVKTTEEIGRTLLKEIQAQRHRPVGTMKPLQN
jgi:hypothetical protein